jgi:hypothetical protein
MELCNIVVSNSIVMLHIIFKASCTWNCCIMSLTCVRTCPGDWRASALFRGATRLGIRAARLAIGYPSTRPPLVQPVVSPIDLTRLWHPTWPLLINMRRSRNRLVLAQLSALDWTATLLSCRPCWHIFYPAREGSTPCWCVPTRLPI